MTFGSLQADDEHASLAEINMVPLIDVMLVLLVIFLVTAPLLTHSIKVDLPKASSSPYVVKSENIQVSIDAAGLVYWNAQVVDAAALGARLRAAATMQPASELHIRAARTTPYWKVAQLMSEAARAGVTKIGFITDPTQP